MAGQALGAVNMRRNSVYGLESAKAELDNEVVSRKLQKPKYVAIYRTTYKGEYSNMDTQWFVDDKELLRWLQDPYNCDLSSLRIIEIKKEVPIKIKISLEEEKE